MVVDIHIKFPIEAGVHFREGIISVRVSYPHKLLDLSVRPHVETSNWKYVETHQWIRSGNGERC